MPTTPSLESLERRRAEIAERIAALGDLRSGSITATIGRCGKPKCRCHQPGQPAHGPNLRLTFKLQGKTRTQSLPDAAALHKAQREIEEFRIYQALHREFLEINARICQLRPTEASLSSPQEKKRLPPSNKRRHAK